MVDWEMGPSSGIELTKRIRTASDSPNPFLPIIMVSGYSEVARVLKARDAGVNEFLAKPVSAHSIYTRIKMLIERPRTFVRSPAFVGPDRRRCGGDRYDGEERRGGVRVRPRTPNRPSRRRNLLDRRRFSDHPAS